MSQTTLTQFADKLSEVMPLLAREFSRRQPDELYKGKVTLPQLLVMDFLSRQDNPRMTDIAHFMRVTTAAMTGIVDRLVRDGYVLRTYDSQDRRIIKIKLTPQGNSLVKRFHEHRRKTVMDVFAKISESDRQDYLRVLMRVKEILNQGGSLPK